MPITIRTTGFDEFVDPSGGAYIKALIMGQHGSGKTPSAAQWPKPIIADCERGLMSVAGLKVPYATITSSADMDALLEHLRLDGLKAPDKRKYQTLVIDTIDSYQKKLIAERLKAERKESLSGWADWGFLDAKMSQLIEKMLNLPMHIVVNLHVKDERDSGEDGEDSILVKKARLKGDIKDSIFQDFDLIGQMENYYVAVDGERVTKRQIRWHSEPKFPALRDRSNKLPRFTEVNFTPDDFWQIFNTITADLDNLPESGDVETLATEGDQDVVPAEVKGGPVEAAIPAKKAAPAKKAPAKKAAPKAPEPTPVAKETVNTETGEITTDEDAAVELLSRELDATPMESPADETPPAKPEPQAEPTPAKTARSCGDQPDSMVGKFAAHPGCGVTLSADNAGRASLAMLKFKTYLCDECFAKAKDAA